MLCQLAVFNDGFSQAAAEAVCGDGFAHSCIQHRGASHEQTLAWQRTEPDLARAYGTLPQGLLFYSRPLWLARETFEGRSLPPSLDFDKSPDKKRHILRGREA